MAISPTVTDISALAANNFVVGFLDLAGRTELFASKKSCSYAVISGSTLPSVASVTAVQNEDNPSGPERTGYYQLALTPAASDTVNSSSPMLYVVDTNCQVLTNATAS